MKLAYIGIVRNDPKPVIQLSAEMDVSQVPFFYRAKMQQILAVYANISATGTNPGERREFNSEEDEKYRAHTFRHSTGSITGVMITDLDYPSLPAQKFLSKIVDEYLSEYTQDRIAAVKAPAGDGQHSSPLPFAALKEYLQKYQDPHEADSLSKIYKDLDETKAILHKTIESVLERGQKIDDLVTKSANLQGASNQFYRQAKKQNSTCCNFM